ncbi:MAG: uracil-DNA glycosylase [Hyphomicrobiaceae bacterium]|nr:MAG: uracil-DNA glycosylase [Hyphomicrobiaceae bacterium]
MLDKARTAELTALLAWYRDVGVDQAVEDAPTDWLARGNLPPGHAFRASAEAAPQLPPREAVRATPTAPIPGAQTPQLAAPRRQFPAAVPDAAVMAARTAARDAATLEELGATLARFDGCSLKATAKNLCFYRGAPKARVMLIGEAPGRDEDLEGKPFVGRAGQLLDKMLAAVQLGESDVHITNIVYWRPPGNRTPTPQEAQVCRPFLERQIELVAPELIVLLGGAAAKHVLDVTDGIMRIRGKLRDIEIGSVRVRAIATLHPAYLLRTPAAKRLAWRDLLTLKSALGA